MKNSEYLIAIGLLVLISITAIAVFCNAPIFGASDSEMFFFLNTSVKNPFLDAVMPLVTDYAPSVLLLLAATLIALRKREISPIFLISIFIVLVFVVGTKGIASVERPAFAEEGAHVYDAEYFPSWTHAVKEQGDGKTRWSHESFPSGHTAKAFFVLGILWVYLGSGPIRIILAAIALLVALSRPYVGVHYPSDILAGAIAGFLVPYVLVKYVLPMYENIKKREKNKNRFKNIEYLCTVVMIIGILLLGIFLHL